MAELNLQSTFSPGDSASEYERLQFVINSLLNKVRTSLPCQVMSVTNSGGVSPIGTVSVKPLVSQLDGNGNAIDHGTIFNVPYLRIQGGGNAVILDPQVGDIGLVCVADRDFTTVQKTKAAAPPASNRKYDLSDAIYTSSILSGTPTQYVRFSASGIVVHSPTKVTIEAPTAQVDCTTSTVNASGSASVTSPSISLGATGQTLLSFVTSAFQSLFNSHTHTAIALGSPTSVPNQTMGASHMTTTVKGG